MSDERVKKVKKETSDGSTASYYELPSYAEELQDLISYKCMNAQMGEIFRAAYRYGQVEHSDQMRDINKILFYAKAELSRLKMERDAEQNLRNHWGLDQIDPVEGNEGIEGARE